MKRVTPLNILVLCTGNICRSPVAEAMLSSKLSANTSDVHVSSAGTRAPAGVPPHPSAILSAANLGYVLDARKRSRQVLQTDLITADLVLTMGRGHKQYVQKLSPGCSSKTFAYGQWTVGDISDPIGENQDFFDAVVIAIAEATEAWIPRINALF